MPNEPVQTRNLYYWWSSSCIFHLLVVLVCQIFHLLVLLICFWQSIISFRKREKGVINLDVCTLLTSWYKSEEQTLPVIICSCLAASIKLKEVIKLIFYFSFLHNCFSFFFKSGMRNLNLKSEILCYLIPEYLCNLNLKTWASNIENATWKLILLKQYRGGGDWEYWEDTQNEVSY